MFVNNCLQHNSTYVQKSCQRLCSEVGPSEYQGNAELISGKWADVKGRSFVILSCCGTNVEKGSFVQFQHNLIRVFHLFKE